MIGNNCLTNVQLYAMLMKKIKMVGMTQEKVDKAIESYLERNPVKKIQYDSENRVLK